MGRKKTQIVEEPKKEEQKIEINPSSSTKIEYKGSVNISIKKNGRITQSRTIKNSGYKPMSDFLTWCLAGQLLTTLQPNYIALFNNSGDNNIRLNDQTRKSKNSEPQKQLDENDNEIDNVVTYYFIIPYQSISSQTGQINKIALYNDDNSIGINSVTELTNFQLEQYASAIITLSSPISLSGLGSGDSILVNWSMTISTSNE